MADWYVGVHKGNYDGLIDAIARQSAPIEVWRPAVRVGRYRDSRFVHEWEPLLFNYIFVRQREIPNATWDAYEDGKRLPLAWVKFGEEIATVTDDDIDHLRIAAHNYNRTIGQLADGERYYEQHAGRPVEIDLGDANTMYGTVVAPAALRNVFVEVTILGGPTRCRVSIDRLRLLKPTTEQPANQVNAAAGEKQGNASGPN